MKQTKDSKHEDKPSNIQAKMEDLVQTCGLHGILILTKRYQKQWGGNQLLNLLSCGWETLSTLAPHSAGNMDTLAPIRSLLTTGTSVSASEPVAEWCNPRGGDSHNLNGKSQQ